MKTKSKSKKAYYFAVGRRKTAIARVRLYPKVGDLVVNNLPIDKYFPGPMAKALYLKPLVITATDKKFSASIRVVGSGKAGQLTAVVHGLARALSIFNPDYKKPLRVAGLITRDPRTRERRMVGMGGKSRRRKQSPKR